MGTKYSTMLWAAPIWRPITDFWRKSSAAGFIWKYMLFGWLFDPYEVTFIPVNEELNKTESVVIPKQVIQDIIRKTSHRAILPSCICRVGCGCENHDMSIGCIFLGEATKQMDPSLGKPSTVDEALKHLDRAIDNGLIPQIGKVDPDAFWSGVEMKDWDKFLTLCLCCSCCCIAMRKGKHYDWVPEVRAKMKKMEGVEINIDDNCNGCGNCEDKCFTEAISISNKQASIDYDKCKLCGICADHCPKKAITVTVTDEEEMLKVIYGRVESYGDIIPKGDHVQDMLQQKKLAQTPPN